MQYRKIFEKSWQELREMARNGMFTPHQKQDIVCMMYHLCLEKLDTPKRIHTSSTWNFNLVLGDVEGEKRKEQKFTHCLLAEFKFILKPGRKKVLKEARKALDGLSREGNAYTRRVFAIFDKVNCIEPEEIEELKRCVRNVTILHSLEIRSRI